MVIETIQQETCARFETQFVACANHQRVGVSRDARVPGHAWPVHGLRHKPAAGTSGWYIWVGELATDPDFFDPLCVEHLPADFPEVVPYLGLAPGWRFAIAPGYEDVWYDPQLLEAS